ncbi:hypothetical protein BDV93DRAFT_607456, partial [Ceratobasidium sp. AG-I]
MSHPRQRVLATHTAPLNTRLLRPTPEAPLGDASSMQSHGSGPTMVSPDSRPSSRLGIRSEGSLIGGIDIGISSAGSTVFDYQGNSTQIRPRRVVEMQCHSE